MFIKKRFSVFLSRLVCICIQSLEKMLRRAKKFFLQKFNMVIKKTQNFRLISNALKKNLKNVPKKVISQNVTEICTFSTFTHVRQTCFADNFFLHFFKLFQRICKIRMKLWFFLIFLGHISTFSNFEAKRPKMAQFCIIKGSVILKKSKIRCTLMHIAQTLLWALHSQQGSLFSFSDWSCTSSPGELTENSLSST